MLGVPCLCEKLLDGKEMQNTVTQAKHDPGSTSQSAHVIISDMMVVGMIHRMIIRDPPNHDD